MLQHDEAKLRDDYNTVVCVACTFLPAEISGTQETATREFFVMCRLSTFYLPYLVKKCLSFLSFPLVPSRQFASNLPTRAVQNFPGPCWNRDIEKSSPIICSRELRGSAKCSQRERRWSAWYLRSVSILIISWKMSSTRDNTRLRDLIFWENLNETPASPATFIKHLRLAAYEIRSDSRNYCWSG